MVLYLAALQGIPQDLYEAAAIDGANAWHNFRYITWPSVAPVTFFILTMGLIHGFQSGFEAAYIMTGGGPSGSTTTIGYYIYHTAYVNFEMGYAAAIACVLFVLVLAVTLLNWRQGQKNITIDSNPVMKPNRFLWLLHLPLALAALTMLLPLFLCSAPRWLQPEKR
ncbi:MAG: sugar ABC transporter permease [Blastochloris sp.]|nr:sugar ABC transporter permease [Blastochloris sp.]